jgi:hypothetical protein
MFSPESKSREAKGIVRNSPACGSQCDFVKEKPQALVCVASCGGFLIFYAQPDINTKEPDQVLDRLSVSAVG